MRVIPSPRRGECDHDDRFLAARSLTHAALFGSGIGPEGRPILPEGPSRGPGRNPGGPERWREGPNGAGDPLKRSRAKPRGRRILPEGSAVLPGGREVGPSGRRTDLSGRTLLPNECGRNRCTQPASPAGNGDERQSITGRSHAPDRPRRVFGCARHLFGTARGAFGGARQACGSARGLWRSARGACAPARGACGADNSLSRAGKHLSRARKHLSRTAKLARNRAEPPIPAE